ncbi:MAG: O-antigen ligase C-terminal domain-containing protein [Betaproteobacteria bacterium]|nr:O-antigen ligase C-terminal domain-containing protein [Betaproteobacteria bacterium]
MTQRWRGIHTPRRDRSQSSAVRGAPGAGGHAGMLVTLALGALLSVPLLIPYHRYPLTSFYSEWAAFALAALALAALAASLGIRRIALPECALAPLLLGAVVMVQAATGRFAFGEETLLVGLYLALAALLMVVGATLRPVQDYGHLLAWLAWFVFAGGVLNALAGIAQYLSVADWLSPLVTPLQRRGVWGNLAQQNHFVNHLALGLGSLLYLAGTRRMSRGWAAVAALGLLFPMALSGSRSSWIFLIGFAAIARLGLQDSPARRRLVRAALLLLAAYAVALAILYALALAQPGGGDAVYPFERWATPSTAVTPRLYLWNHALVMFIGAPLFGVGFGEFAYHMFLQWPLVDSRGVTSIDNHAHNIVLQLLSLAGAAGFAAVALPMLRWLRRQAAMPRSLESWWLWAMLWVLAFHSMLEQPLWYAYFLAPAALLVGMSDTRQVVRDFSAGLKGAALVLAALGTALALNALADYDRLEGWLYDFRYARGASQQARAATIRSLESRSLFAPFVRLAHPEVLVPESAPGQDKIRLSERLMRFAPTAEVVYRHAAILAGAGHAAEAVVQLQRAAAVYPGDLAEYATRIARLAEREPGKYRALAGEAQALLAASGAR